MVSNGVGNCFFSLNKAAKDAVKSNVQISASSLFALVSPDDKTYSNAVHSELLSKLALLEKSRRTYRVGRQIQNWLLHSGPFRELHGVLKDAGNLEASARRAKKIGEIYLNRDEADKLIDRAESEKKTHAPVVGDGRLWFINQITEISRLAVEWAGTVLDNKPSSHEEQVLRPLAKQIVKSSREADLTLKELVEKHGPLAAAAADVARTVLTRLQGLATGKEAPTVDMTRAMIALHGPLLWAPGMVYGGDWVPSPYPVDLVISSMLKGCPEPRESRHNPESFVAAFHARLDEGSFLAARLLLEVGERYGIPRETLDALGGDIEAKREDRFFAINDQIKETLANVMRAQRYTIKHNDDLQDAYERLNQVHEDYLKKGDLKNSDVGKLDLVDPSDRYAPDILATAGQEILQDFNAIEALIEDTEDKIKSVFELEKQPLLNRLDDLESKAEDKESFARIRQEVEALIETQQDLAAADELLEHHISDTPEPNRGMIQPVAFRDFFETLDLPTILSSKDYDLEAVREALVNGNDYLGIPFSRVDEKTESLARLERWQEFRKDATRKNTGSKRVLAAAASLLEALDFRNVSVTPDPSRSVPTRREHVGDMKLSINADRESVLLPDFGSMTGGTWRLAVYPSMPKYEQGDFDRLTNGPSHIGVMVIVPDVVSQRDREKLAEIALKHKYKLLIIDESIFLYALSEQDFRSLTMLEIAQAFSFSDPYRDYQNYAVPPEMFKGRREEYERLKNMNTGFIVYGGRRLGKTALLKHLEQQEHSEETGTLRVYISIHTTADTRDIWREGSKALSAVFSKPVDEAERFKDRVISWLEKDARRSIILMVDECDEFVKLDESEGFAAIKTLNKIMVGTNRRFKVVLAGLQNALRLTRNLENAPLTHMDSGILEIGPMIGKDVADAERLITGPLAGMGYHFANDRDVWQILSYCNYYPVLIQLVGESLVSTIRERVADNGVLVRKIDDTLVREVLNDPKTLEEIKRAFDKTLDLDGERYKLLTYIIANHMIDMNAAHKTDEGMRATEVLDLAAYFWPAAFVEDVRPEDVADLLKEMVVLGLLRSIDDYRWTLRSRSTLAFIGGNRAVEDGVLRFADKPRPQSLEHTHKRRELGNIEGRGSRRATLRRSVLTIGQEHQIAQNRARKPVLVFGHNLASVDQVATCLRSFRKDLFDVRVLQAKNVKAFRNELSRLKLGDSSKRTLLVVDKDREWDPIWVNQAKQSRKVRDGELTIVFIGGPPQALSWASSHSSPSPEFDVVSLEPWRRSFIASFLHQGLVDNFDSRAEEILGITGGWSGLIDDILDKRISKENVDKRFSQKMRQIHSSKSEIVVQLGLGDDAIAAGIRAVITYEIGDHFAENDFLDAAALEINGDESNLKPETLLAYYRLLDLVEVVPSTRDDKRSATKGTRYRINPLVMRLMQEETVDA
ncbi:MAG: hypothetical protein GDA49_04140 [Rhodospirillales bacterium]|nr:hypothetical protein [Rhodospirillales bacterium]